MNIFTKRPMASNVCMIFRITMKSSSRTSCAHAYTFGGYSRSHLVRVRAEADAVSTGDVEGGKTISASTLRVHHRSIARQKRRVKRLGTTIAPAPGAATICRRY